MKPLIITHKNCIDGCCSKALLFSKFGTEATYLELDHANLDPTKDSNADKYLGSILKHKNTEVYMSDFVLPSNMIEELLNNQNKVVVLDHHESSIPHLQKFKDRKILGENIDIEIHFSEDNTKSGTLITWEYLYPNIEPPMSIKHISAGDVWKFEYGEDTKYFYTGLMEAYKDAQHVPPSTWKKIIENVDYHHELIAIGKPLREQYMAEVMSYVNLAKPIFLNGVEGLIVEAPKKYTSDLGNQLAQKLNGNGFGLVYFTDEESEMVRCSLRSIAPISVKTIAETFGGGGHAQASAFRCLNHEEFRLNILTNIVDNSKKIKP